MDSNKKTWLLDPKTYEYFCAEDRLLEREASTSGFNSDPTPLRVPQDYVEGIMDRIRRDLDNVVRYLSPWQDITLLEPQQGERIIGVNNKDVLYWEYFPYIAQWDARNAVWRLTGDPEAICTPTHFMTYPSAPEGLPEND